MSEKHVFGFWLGNDLVAQGIGTDAESVKKRMLWSDAEAVFGGNHPLLTPHEWRVCLRMAQAKDYGPLKR